VANRSNAQVLRNHKTHACAYVRQLCSPFLPKLNTVSFSLYLVKRSKQILCRHAHNTRSRPGELSCLTLVAIQPFTHHLFLATTCVSPGTRRGTLEKTCRISVQRSGKTVNPGEGYMTLTTKTILRETHTPRRRVNATDSSIIRANKSFRINSPH
jgi:hypothetical protein